MTRMNKKIILLFSLVLLSSISLFSHNSKKTVQELLQKNQELYNKARAFSDDKAKSLIYLDSMVYDNHHIADSSFRRTIAQVIELIYSSYGDSITLNKLYEFKAVAIKRGDSVVLANIEDYVTEIFINQSEFDKALESANSALSIYEEFNDLTNQGKVILKIAAIQYSQGDYISSIETVFEAADYFKSAGSSRHLAFSYLQIGTTYLFIQQYDLAKENLLLAKEQFLFEGDTLGAAMSEANIALVFFEEKDYKNALDKFKEASIEIIKSQRNIPIAKVFQNIGVSFYGLGEYDSAQIYLSKALSINNAINYDLGISTVYLDYARLMYEQGKLDSCIHFAKKSLESIEETGDIEAHYSVLGVLGKALYESGEILQGAPYLYQHLILEDSVNLEDEYIESIAYKQDAKIKQFKEQLLIEKQKQELFQKENSYQKNLILILGILGIVLISLIIVVLLINNKNSRLNKVLSQNQMTIQSDLEIKNNLLKEIHHRVKNNLQVISSMLSIQGQYLEDEKFQEVINECRNRISSMALIHESLYKKDPNDITSIGSYFKKLIPQLIDTYHVDEGRIKLNLDIDDVELSLDESIPCGLLINEIVSNALKHAFPNEKSGEIEISLKQNNETCLLTIRDNGIGLPDGILPEKQDSFGFLLIYTLVNQLEGQLNLIRKDGLAFHLSWKIGDKSSFTDA